MNKFTLPLIAMRCITLCFFCLHSAFADGCNLYATRITNNSHDTWSLAAINITHGKMIKSDKRIEPGTTGEIVLDAYSILSYFGPKADVTYYDEDVPLKQFKILLAQDYCLLSAGDIHSQILFGNNYVRHVDDSVGSFTKHIGGRSEFVVTVF